MFTPKYKNAKKNPKRSFNYKNKNLQTIQTLLEFVFNTEYIFGLIKRKQMQLNL